MGIGADFVTDHEDFTPFDFHRAKSYFKDVPNNIFRIFAIVPLGPKAKALVEKDKQMLSPSSTRSSQLVGARAEGIYMAVLRVIEEEKLVEKARLQGNYFDTGLSIIEDCLKKVC